MTHNGGYLIFDLFGAAFRSAFRPRYAFDNALSLSRAFNFLVLCGVGFSLILK